MLIRLLDSIVLSPKGLCSYKKTWTHQDKFSVSLTQGDLDGACGPYALMMTLISLGAISKKEAVKIWGDPIDQRTKLAKAMKSLDTLLRTGTSSTDLIQLLGAIQHYFRSGHSKLKLVTYEETSLKGKALVSYCVGKIKNSEPVILGLDWRGKGAHWVTVIGYQENDENKIESLLVLDPSSPMRDTSAWNGVIDVFNVSAGKKPYTYWSDVYEERCMIVDTIAFRTS